MAAGDTNVGSRPSTVGKSTLAEAVEAYWTARRNAPDHIERGDHFTNAQHREADQLMNASWGQFFEATTALAQVILDLGQKRPDSTSPTCGVLFEGVYYIARYPDKDGPQDDILITFPATDMLTF